MRLGLGGDLVFKKILIANRGEIAVRIIKACRELGIKSVAIYSEVDKDSLHVKLADESYLIGPPQPPQSYLNVEKILDVIEKSGAEAVHPGYGFLAENAEFAEAVESIGATFIGPSPEIIRLMGNKTEARKAMKKAGLPVVPGTLEPVRSLNEAKKIADDLGYPIVIKGVFAGGGKGMRIVRTEDELENALESAQRESQLSFNSAEIYIEKFIESPRHIEVQILRDLHGNCVALGERDCSIQRRFQKIIEEAPSPVISDLQRKELMDNTIEAMNKIGYTNAGTVEFIYDRKEREFYFLEMNTRIQVEHPVTEMVTGVDIVKNQILIAAGGVLDLQQKDVTIRGHSIECRIYAEDPTSFIPSPGAIEGYSEPSGEGVRVDSGVTEGSKVPLYYDSLISKVIVKSTDRQKTIHKMKDALNNYRISGIKTNIPFLLKILDHPSYLSGDYDVYFVEREFLN